MDESDCVAPCEYPPIDANYKHTKIDAWRKEDVAMWLQAELNFKEEWTNLFIVDEMSGESLLLEDSLKGLASFYHGRGLPKPNLHELWQAICVLKTLVPLRRYDKVHYSWHLSDYVFSVRIRTDVKRVLNMNAQVLWSSNRLFVLKTRYRGSDKSIGVKCIHDTYEGLLLNEISILKQRNEAKVPNVPQLLFTGDLSYYANSFHCFATDLIGESIMPNIHMPLSELKVMIGDVLAALKAMHQLNIVHGDVKPANIVRIWDTLLGRNKYYLVGFGHSFLATSEYVPYDYSIPYASIEILRGSNPTMKDDHKSLWYTAYETLLGELPWEPVRNSKQLTRWAKEGWQNSLAARGSLTDLIFLELYRAIDESLDPFLAWQQFENRLC